MKNAHVSLQAVVICSGRVAKVLKGNINMIYQATANLFKTNEHFDMSMVSKRKKNRTGRKE